MYAGDRSAGGYYFRCREVLRRTQEYLRSGEDFAIETTLSGKWTTSTVKEAMVRGSFVRLVYVCVDNSKRSVQRVRERVAQGGDTMFPMMMCDAAIPEVSRISSML